MRGFLGRAAERHSSARSWRLAVAMSCLAVTVGCSDLRGGGDARTPGSGRAPTTAAPTAASSPTATANADLPASMAALGDSVTRAFATCASSGDCPPNSWATGTVDGLASHAQRIEQLSGRAPEVHNLAVSGATVSGLGSQVAAAVAADVDYVTVLIGANDACAPSEDAMTPLGRFQDTFDDALATLVRGLPRARILVVSIPDLARLWEVGSDHDEVVATWERFEICQSMLDDARSSAPNAEARRDRVRARVAEYNRAMAAACARYPMCRSDGGAVFDYEFTLEMVSEADFWHPSFLGQRTLAEVTWGAGFWR